MDSKAAKVLHVVSRALQIFREKVQIFWEKVQISRNIVWVLGVVGSFASWDQLQVTVLDLERITEVQDTSKVMLSDIGRTLQWEEESRRTHCMLFTYASISWHFIHVAPITFSDPAQIL